MAGNKNSGRRPKALKNLSVQSILDASAEEAARILDNFIQQRKGWKRVSRDLLDACKYVIDHAIGKAKQKVEHSGGIVTYADLAKGANELDIKPRPILADIEEIASKYQEKLEKEGKNST